MTSPLYFHQRIRLIPVCLTALLAGCGPETTDAPSVVPVTGTVTVEGQPLAGAGVSFRPDRDKGNESGFMPGGSTDASGKYELMATAGAMGAPPGWYKVLVMPPSAPPGSDDVVEFPEYNAKYQDPETTDLSFEVKEGAAPVVIDIDLEP